MKYKLIKNPNIVCPGCGQSAFNCKCIMRNDPDSEEDIISTDLNYGK